MGENLHIDNNSFSLLIARNDNNQPAMVTETDSPTWNIKKRERDNLFYKDSHFSPRDQRKLTNVIGQETKKLINYLQLEMKKDSSKLANSKISLHNFRLSSEGNEDICQGLSKRIESEILKKEDFSLLKHKHNIRKILTTSNSVYIQKKNTLINGGNTIFPREKNEDKMEADDKSQRSKKTVKSSSRQDFLKKSMTGFQLQYTEKRIPLTFRNVYDSFDSDEEEKEFNYFDYVPRRFSIIEDSSPHRFLKNSHSTIVFLAIVYYSTLLAVFDRSFFINKKFLILLISSIFEIYFSIYFIAQYFLIAYQDNYLNKLNFNPIKIFIKRSQNIIVGVDLISMIPLMIFFEFHSNNIFMKLLCLTKILMVFHLFNWIHFSSIFEFRNKSLDSDKQNSSSRIDIILVGLKIFLLFILIIHIFACAWLGITDSNIELNNNSNWILLTVGRDGDFLKKYVASVYFSVTTLFTVGYGDIRPCNTYERVVVIIFLIVGCLIYSLVLTIVSGLLKMSSLRDQIYEERLSTLNNISAKFSIPLHFYRQLLSSIKHNYKHWKLDKEELLNALPNSLKSNLQLKIYSNIISQFSYFRNIDDRNFILSLTEKLQSSIFEKNYVLLEKGDNLDEMYFISEGQIEIRLRIDNYFSSIKLSKLSAGMVYGDILMYSYAGSPYDLKTTSQRNILYTLKKVDFNNLKINYDRIISELLKKSYSLHILIENKKLLAVQYYFKHFGFAGFNHYYSQCLDYMIYEEIFSKIDSDINNKLDRIQSILVKHKTKQQVNKNVSFQLTKKEGNQGQLYETDNLIKYQQKSIGSLPCMFHSDFKIDHIIRRSRSLILDKRIESELSCLPRKEKLSWSTRNTSYKQKHEYFLQDPQPKASPTLDFKNAGYSRTDNFLQTQASIQSATSSNDIPDLEQTQVIKHKSYPVQMSIFSHKKTSKSLKKKQSSFISQLKVETVFQAQYVNYQFELLKSKLNLSPTIRRRQNIFKGKSECSELKKVIELNNINHLIKAKAVQNQNDGLLGNIIAKFIKTKKMKIMRSSSE